MRRRYNNYRGKPFQGWKKALFALVLAGILVFSTLFGAVCGGARDRVAGEPGALVVLGCQVRESGPSILLQDRLNEALDYWKNHPDVLVVVSGGQGSNEPTTEARAMADYLLAAGVPEQQLLLEDRSHNTSQNLRYSKQVLEQAGYDLENGVAVVSNGFHLTRATMLAKRFGYGQVSKLAAPSSHMLSRLSMYIREPLALAKSFLFDW